MRDTIHLDQPKEIVCIECPNGCRILAEPSESGVRFSGYRCKRGLAYAEAELTRPMRTLTTSVRTVFADSPVVSVRTDGEIEKAMIRDVIDALGRIVVTRRIRIGDVVTENVCGTGVNIVCTSDRLVNAY